MVTVDIVGILLLHTMSTSKDIRVNKTKRFAVFDISSGKLAEFTFYCSWLPQLNHTLIVQ